MIDEYYFIESTPAHTPHPPPPPTLTPPPPHPQVKECVHQLRKKHGSSSKRPIGAVVLLSHAGVGKVWETKCEEGVSVLVETNSGAGAGSYNWRTLKLRLVHPSSL